MGTEFGSLSTALTALQAERKALEVTGQNIANASTSGYTRQRAVFQGIGGSVVPAMYSRSDGVGAGVVVSEVQRLQNAFLEQRANTENGTLAFLQGSQQTLADIENSFGEPSTTGIQSLLTTFWNGWDDVANNPSDTAARTALIGDAQALASGLNVAAGALSAQWASSRQSLQSVVDQVNAAAQDIAALNKAIVAATSAGNQPNDLEDQRDVLIRKLASLVGVTTKPKTDGSTDVLLGGSSLVSGSLARQLQLGGGTAIDQVSTTPVTLTWSDTGTTAAVSSGQGAALLTALNVTIPSYAGQLDSVANQLVTTVNTQHQLGYDLNGNAGGDFFDPTGTTAATIKVAITDPALVAASSVPPSAGQPSLDGGNAQALANMAGTGADAAYRKMIVALGSESNTMQQRTTTQQSVVNQVEASRDSASGVDLDEEQTNLIMFQHAYDAAAKYLSVIDSILDTLINQTLA
ncbi:MAG: flagellar hook-associated protein FlgK [Acidothermus cellulolyticus]|nr:flagellar hook-associated protein FlgK [Acidothermus cellulolyticus]MCL6550442.1 flagellar hook-associated protein FlgK [Acidothermus cellulolyticus]